MYVTYKEFVVPMLDRTVDLFRFYLRVVDTVRNFFRGAPLRREPVVQLEGRATREQQNISSVTSSIPNTRKEKLSCLEDHDLFWLEGDDDLTSLWG